MRKEINSSLIAVLLCGSVLLSGCGHHLKEEAAFKKVKDITAEELIKENLGEKSDRESLAKDTNEKGTTMIGGTKVSLSCPDGWTVNVNESEEYSDFNYISAWKDTAPKYDLTVEAYSDYYNLEAEKIIKSAEKEVNNMTKDYGYDFDQSIIEDIKNAYAKELTHKGRYQAWTEVSFEETTINQQVYVAAKGKIEKPAKNKRERGAYWYITIRNGKVITFQFQAKHPEMDASVVDIFEGIMESVTYE